MYPLPPYLNWHYFPFSTDYVSNGKLYVYTFIRFEYDGAWWQVLVSRECADRSIRKEYIGFWSFLKEKPVHMSAVVLAESRRLVLRRAYALLVDNLMHERLLCEGGEDEFGVVWYKAERERLQISEVERMEYPTEYSFYHPSRDGEL